MIDLEENTPVPAADLEFLTRVINFARQIYGSHGSCHPLAMIHKDGTAQATVIFAENLGSEMGKQLAINTVKYAIIMEDADRAAFVIESWTVSPSSAGMLALLQQIKETGRSLTEHPEVSERVGVFVQSENGTTLQMLTITRIDPRMAELEMDGPPQFASKDCESTHFAGNFANFYVPRALRDTPEIHAFMKDMNEAVALIPTDGLADDETANGPERTVN